ncbi:(2Fe-2S)-binding protein [candidate division KSB1 bacterium]|nr:(2Fe-2S)-binding protein [candidate division KSB1 bacterium]MCH8286231.1 (2Fe-2S)-binding protein [candidate division KSB1 bacterium]
MSKSRENTAGDGNRNGNGVTRRSFIKGMGAGVVTTAILPSVVSAGVDLETIRAPEEGVTRATITLNVNGESKRVTVESRATLANTLRNELNMTGTKVVCDRGECGGCSVLIDGDPAYSCMTLAMDAAGREITTIEGLAKNGQLSPVQQAFVDFDAYQCGYCTSGQIIAATGLLEKNSNPSFSEIQRGMSGNICRCAAYQHIFAAVADAAKKGRG